MVSRLDNSGCAALRRGAVAGLFLALVTLLAVSAAQAQRLLTLVPAVGSASSTDGPGPSIGPLPTAARVDLELLRGDPSWLEVPTPDGGVLSAERSVFEDRGDGDLMWSGGQPGAGYDTVVLTVEGGRLVGRFAAAGGRAYQIHSERDGRGGMAAIVGPAPDSPIPLCAVHEDADAFHDAALHAAAGARAAAAPVPDPPRPVSNPQSHDRLDILVIYTATAAKNWADRGGAHAAIRHAGDYLKMVFRNNQIDVEPHIVHIAEGEAALDRTGMSPLWRRSDRPLWPLLEGSGEVLRLRHEHRPDLVHLFSGERWNLLDACGTAWQFLGDVESFSSSGLRSSAGFTGTLSWSTNRGYPCPDYAETFVHEIGHALGADHEPANASNPEFLVRPYALGHVDYDVMPALGTVMSYRGQNEPFFSSPRIRPWGAVLGIADKQDNERTLQETVHMAVRFSDYLERLEDLPAQPTDLRLRFEAGEAHLTWRDNAPDADGYLVGQFFYPVWPVEGRTTATIPLHDAPPGSYREFSVWARRGDKNSLRSRRVPFIVPGERIEAPSDVSVTLFKRAVHVQWSDNSHNEEGFDVQLLQGDDLIARRRVAANGEETAFFPGLGDYRGGVEYGVRVYAFSSWGASESSEVATFQRSSRSAPSISASVIGPTTVRVAWPSNLSYAYLSVDARVPGWDVGTNVDREPFDPRWVDFEGLARGGRYVFSAVDELGLSGPESLAFVTLGERGLGPRAPSDLSWEMTDDGEIRVLWRDNSSDETGFEVQTGATRSNPWFRVAIVPPNTESVVYNLDDVGPNEQFRVFAYNERGFSRSSPRLFGPPHIRQLRAVAGDAEVRLLWDARPTATLTGMQVRWKPAADLPFVDGSDPWRDIPSFVSETRRLDGYRVNGEHTVTGLTNDTEYAFALRPLSKWGPLRLERITVTPTAPRGSCRADEETICLRNARFEVKADWRTADGASGPGRVVPEGTDDSGLFRFFNPSNWEVLIKVLNGCSHNGRVWVLGASTTDLGYRITVRDTIAEESRSYTSEPGRPAPAIVDTQAFSAPCAEKAE